eukprot:scaffold79845_cov46-Phaeocystis_antarctica.AAC.3
MLHYDELPNDALEWQCVCRLATCVKATPRRVGLADPNPVCRLATCVKARWVGLADPDPNPDPRHLRQGALVRAS